MSNRIAGREAAQKKGWLQAQKWLLFRRLSQLLILGLFMLGPMTGVWIIKGSMSASLTLGFLPMTDPLILLQSFVAGHSMAAKALIGALIVAAFYFLIGGRVYCSWVCPVNIFTDGAAWVNRKLDQKKSLYISRSFRYWLLVAVLIMAYLTGSVIWEWLNPVTIFQRGLLFGMGLGWFLLGGILFIDTFLIKRGWCGHLCPVGAFYSVLGFFSFLRVKASRRQECTDCMDCFTICPEPQVIRPALKGDAQSSPVILSNNCINCGRCIDICPQDVFRFSKRS
ncbi:MAG: quinol dehydrogenase ferredoxin subunit NapH [Deltaproteobacteria bacterium]|jgi:ferredoxin-type protein NapH|nr:quinol dehydrogenase ferredoxin subunit NapH [Deltaproteobacteria bacterium]